MVALKGMGDDFVASYVKVAEGEKDPRNLLMAFGIMRVILIEFDPYLHLEVSRIDQGRVEGEADPTVLPRRICLISCSVTSLSHSVHRRTIRTE